MYLEVGHAEQVLQDVGGIILLVEGVGGEVLSHALQSLFVIEIAHQQRMVGKLAHVHHHGHAAVLVGGVDLELIFTLIN